MSARDLRQIPDPDLSLSLAREADTVVLAEDIAAVLQPGDLLCLSGDLGAGKSTLSRALLRALADDDDLEVPSPTFTLVQSYDLSRFGVAHLDLYRLEEPEELEELGLEEQLETGAALVEWPEHGADLLPSSRVWLRIDGEDDDSRQVHFKFENTDFAARFNRSRVIRAFLDRSGRDHARRRYLKGDASARTYERISCNGERAVLMNAPAQPDETVPEATRAYRQTVHLAQDIRPFVAIGRELSRHGYRAPAIHAEDLDHGLLLLEDLGDTGVLMNGEPDPERYEAAVLLLAQMHGEDWPAEVPVGDGTYHKVPRYDRAALLAEADLFLDWYVPEMTGTAPSGELRAEFHALWNGALDRIVTAQNGWVLRDYHSPNLLWQPEGHGAGRVGLIDFQDAVIGPVAYDVASLLLDARVEVRETLETSLFETYVSARRDNEPDFDEQAFSAAYAVMAAQRITKILGIFVRLARRDGKPGYLGHLPRMNAYLDRVLTHPVLSDLKLWYDRNRP